MLKINLSKRIQDAEGDAKPWLELQNNQPLMDKGQMTPVRLWQSRRFQP